MIRNIFLCIGIGLIGVLSYWKGHTSARIEYSESLKNISKTYPARIETMRLFSEVTKTYVFLEVLEQIRDGEDVVRYIENLKDTGRNDIKLYLESLESPYLKPEYKQIGLNTMHRIDEYRLAFEN